MTTSDKTPQRHPILVLFTGLLLCFVGSISAMMWLITYNLWAMLLGLVLGLPFLFNGVGLILGHKKQTITSRRTMRTIGIVCLLIYAGSLAANLLVAPLFLVLAVVCYRAA